MNSRGNSRGDEAIRQVKRDEALSQAKRKDHHQVLTKIAETDDSHLTTQ